jgi:plasmid stability protein
MISAEGGKSQLVVRNRGEDVKATLLRRAVVHVCSIAEEVRAILLMR